MRTTADVGDLAGHVAELIQQVEAGHEVLLTCGNKPVAKLVLVSTPAVASTEPLRIQSLKGHRVLTPIVSQTDLAEEMFGSS